MCTEYYSNNDAVDVFIFGQGAGKKEEALGRPFVGPAGKRMRQIIAYMWKTQGFSIAFSNNVRCHPTENGKDRVPTRGEVLRCKKHLTKDILQLNPLIVIPVGMSATGTYFNVTDSTMARIHGEFRETEARGGEVDLNRKNVRFMPTYHPSYVIRVHGRDSWDEDDLKNWDRVLIADIEKALREAENAVESEIRELVG